VGVMSSLGCLVDTSENPVFAATSAAATRRLGRCDCWSGYRLTFGLGKPGNNGFNDGAKDIWIESFHSGNWEMDGAKGLTALVKCLAVNFDTVDDGHNGGIDGNQLEALCGAGRTALAEKNQLTFTGTDRVDGDDGVLTVLELGRILVVNQLGPEKEQFPSDHQLVLFGGDDLSDDFCEEHQGLRIGTTHASLQGCGRGALKLLAWRAGGTGILGKDAFDGIVRAGDDVRADDLTGFGGDCGTGIERGFDCGDITGDDCVAKSAADLFHRSGEFNVCGFKHRVNANDETCEATGFEKSNCLFGHGSISLV